MRIAIVGAGAVGGYFGARLAAAGNDVAFLARGPTLDALRENGLRISSPLGDLHLTSVEASANPAALAPADLVLVAVKAWQVPELAADLAPMLRPAGCALPLQNGVDAPAQLAAALGAERVLGGLCTILCQVEEPGHIRHLGATPCVALGELDGRRSDRAERLREAFEAAGVAAEIPASIEAALWEKFLFIAAVGSLGAATRMPIGVVRETPETRALLVRSMEEIHAVARARGIALSRGVLEQTLAFIDRLPAAGDASMQRDILAGRPSELEAQTGAVVRHGRQAGVATPVNELLYHLLLPSERLARGR